MDLKIILFLLLWTNILPAQSNVYIGEDYYWESKESPILGMIDFDENGLFELVEIDPTNCSPYYFNYGKGKYQLKNDSILFVFDSIPYLKSICELDSIKNNDEFSNLQIQVVDVNNNPVDNATLSWGKPKKKRKWTTSQFFKEQFNRTTEIKFQNNERINFIRVEKEGFYSARIKIPKQPNKDYKTKIILHPKPITQSSNYISNTRMEFPILSECEIEFYNKRKFKKESCQ